MCFSQPHWEGLSRCCLLTGPTVTAQRLHKLLPDGFYLMPDLRNPPFRGTFLVSQCLRWAVRYTWLMSPGHNCVPYLCVNHCIIRVWPFLALNKYLLRGCPGISPGLPICYPLPDSPLLSLWLEICTCMCTCIYACVCLCVHTRGWMVLLQSWYLAQELPMSIMHEGLCLSSLQLY